VCWEERAGGIRVPQFTPVADAERPGAAA
jgi:hypothetical protein